MGFISKIDRKVQYVEAEHMEAAGGLLTSAVGLVLVAGIMHFTRSAAANGSLERNSVIGIRTKVTNSSDSAWNAGHRAAGPRILVSSWIGYFFGLLSVVIAFVQLAAGAGNAVSMVIPAAGYAGLVIFLLIAAKKANEAGRKATEEQ